MQRTSGRPNVRWTPGEDRMVLECILENRPRTLSKYLTSQVIADKLQDLMGERKWEAIRQRARKLMESGNSRRRTKARPNKVPRRTKTRPEKSEVSPPSTPRRGDDVMDVDGIVIRSFPETSEASTQTRHGDDVDHSVDCLNSQVRSVEARMKAFEVHSLKMSDAIKRMIADRDKMRDKLEEFGTILRRQALSVNPLVLTAEIATTVQAQVTLEFRSQLDKAIDARIGTLLVAQIDSQLGSQLNSEIGSRIGARLSSELDSRLGASVDARIDASVERIMKKRRDHWKDGTQ